MLELALMALIGTTAAVALSAIFDDDDDEVSEDAPEVLSVSTDGEPPEEVEIIGLEEIFGRPISREPHQMNGSAKTPQARHRFVLT